MARREKAMTTRRRILRSGVACALSGVIGQARAQDRRVTDDAGRAVDLPARVSRVFTAGPPANVLLYTLAPELMAGWVREPSAEDKTFLAPAFRDLPVHGFITGRANTANVEAVVAMRPNLVFDLGAISPAAVSLADRVQQQIGVPYVIFEGALANSAKTYRAVAAMLGREARGELLAREAEAALVELRRRIETLPADRRPRVYYARGAQGLETGLAGSINMEALEAVGAINVAAAAGRGGLTTVSPEQVLAWNPDVIITQDPVFFEQVRRHPIWAGVKAVRERRVHRAPTQPFGWFDTPPGVNRLIGVWWLAAILYPRLDNTALRERARQFHATFYHHEPSAAQLDLLLRDAAIRG
jgi:iron complex transport system substrate-binding protein